jgi:DNA invertase Pin-like site-specific DNA recombinase
MGFNIICTYEEVISGGKLNIERPIFSEMMSFIDKNPCLVDKVLIWELSRIGRNAAQVLQTIDTLNQKGVSLYIKNFNLETLDSNGQINQMSQFLLMILNSVNSMERQNLISRLRTGYDRYRNKNNGKVGRKKGSVKSKEQFLKDHIDIIKSLRKGNSVRDTMRITGKSSATVQKVKKAM